jgi:predicted ester cyclase
MRAHLTAVRKTYPDYTIRIFHQCAEGDWVISQFIMEGTHREEWLGIAPSGKHLSFTGVNIDRMKNGKIVEHGGAVNTFETLYEQGLIGPV